MPGNIDIMALLNSRAPDLGEEQDLSKANNGRAEAYTVPVEINGKGFRLDPGKVMGVHIWPAAHGLATHICEILRKSGFGDDQQATERCLELGAGAALPSLVVGGSEVAHSSVCVRAQERLKLGCRHHPHD